MRSSRRSRSPTSATRPTSSPRPLRSDGQHGYVSLEVSPRLAFDTEGTIDEARRLWKALDRPNVFIKVPGTAAGLPAIRRLIAEGINVNVTLLFGLPRYQAVAEAYIAGLEDRLAAGRAGRGVASVASFFLSRIDVAIDAAPRRADRRGRRGGRRAAALRGRAAIASAKRAFVIYQDRFGDPPLRERSRTAARGRNGCCGRRRASRTTATRRPSTSSRSSDPTRSPPCRARRSTPTATTAIPAPAQEGLEEAARRCGRSPSLGIDLDEVTAALEDEGVEKFVKPFESLLETVRDTMAELRS
jgi:transaldolase